METCEAPYGVCPLGMHAPGAPLPRAPEAPPPLEEREAAVLGELAREGDAHVTFQGLRRRLGLHQQVLTRTLRRLESYGLVARDEKGYHPTERGFAASSHPRADEPPREVLAVVQALLPPGADGDAVSARLARRWFQGLRWYGQADAPGETTLTWVSEADGARVRVRVAGGALTLETEVAPGAPDGAFASLRALVAAIADLYAPEASPRAGGAGAAS